MDSGMIKHSVSVIIPNYNRFEQLIFALSSIVYQSEAVSEIIIIDDCSEKYLFNKIKLAVDKLKVDFPYIEFSLIRQKENGGANLCRNVGIFLAKYNYIAFLDSDDIWASNKVKLQMEAIYRAKHRESKPVLSCTGRLRLNSENEIIAQQFSGNKFSTEKLLKSNYLGTLSSAIVETWVARFIGGFDVNFPACQDWDFFIRLSPYVKYCGVSEPLCYYIDHDGERITKGNKKRILGHLKIRRYHIKNSSSPVNMSEFYRNLAEDYSESGDEKKTRRYLSLSFACKKKSKFLFNVYFVFYYIFVSHKMWGSVKEKRYEKYLNKTVEISQSSVDSYLINLEQQNKCLIASDH